MGVSASYKSLPTHPWLPTSLVDEDECWSSLASSVAHPWLLCALCQEPVKPLILGWAGGAAKGWAP